MKHANIVSWMPKCQVRDRPWPSLLVPRTIALCLLSHHVLHPGQKNIAGGKQAESPAADVLANCLVVERREESHASLGPYRG